MSPAEHDSVGGSCCGLRLQPRSLCLLRRPLPRGLLLCRLLRTECSSGDAGEPTTTGDYAWRIISHLSLNYLSLIDQSPEEGAAALRELLSLYSNYSTLSDRQINGILSIKAKPVTRRLPIPGPISFGRGLEIELVMEETAFEAGGMFLFGSVLEEFFSKYVSINNLTETVVRSDRDIEIGRWPVRMGTRPRL